MTLEEVRNLKAGDFVRVGVPVSGGVDIGVDELEVELPDGAIAKISEARDVGGRQGWAVTVVFDNGIVNVFDQADPAPAFPFERVDDNRATKIERIRFLADNLPDNYPLSELMRDFGYIAEGAW